MSKLKERYEGKTFKSNNYGDFVVLEYVDKNNVTIKFNRTGGMRQTTTASILNGNVLDYDVPSVFGVGVVDEQFRKQGMLHRMKSYKVWTAMLKRCYSNTSKGFYHTYEDCKVSDKFLRFRNFDKWCKQQVGFGVEYFDLDKDILSKGGKIYSEDTCCFVPQEINRCLKGYKSKSIKTGVQYHSRDKIYQTRGVVEGEYKHLGNFKTEEEAFLVYKKFKEAHIKSLTEKWKDLIDERAYNALMNYEVSIND